MTNREVFKQTYAPGTGYLVDGQRLNDEGRVLTDVTNRMGLKDAQVVNGQTLPDGPLIFGIATITDASNLCATVPEGGEYAAPCAQVNKYTARFRYFFPGAVAAGGLWVEYDEDLSLDASGYWEGLASEGYGTDASASPSSGYGYGAIPVFQKGDEVPCFFDVQRGWLIPVVSPPADVPLAEFYTTSVQEIPVDADLGEQGLVVAVVEIYRPADGRWVPRQAITWRVPPANDVTDWLDTRSGFVTFDAPSSPGDYTWVRVRMGRGPEYEIDVWDARLTFTGVGRRGSSSYSANYTSREYMQNGARLSNGWALVASVPGRFKDSPGVASAGNGNFRIGYFDPKDEWIMRVEVEITIANEPTNISDSSQSSVSSSTYYSRSSLSYSSRSSVSSTRSWTSASTSGTETSTSSTAVQTTSSSESSTRTGTSESSELDYCPVTVVSDVKCDSEGHVTEVCYRTLLIPSLKDGTPCSEQIGKEICYPCEEFTSGSSQSSPGLTSTSSTHLQSSSTPSSLISTQLSTQSSYGSSENSSDSTYGSSEGSSYGTSTLYSYTSTASEILSSTNVLTLGSSSNFDSGLTLESTFFLETTEAILSGEGEGPP